MSLLKVNNPRSLLIKAETKDSNKKIVTIKSPQNEQKKIVIDVVKPQPEPKIIKVYAIIAPLAQEEIGKKNLRVF